MSQQCALSSRRGSSSSVGSNRLLSFDHMRHRRSKKSQTPSLVIAFINTKSGATAGGAGNALKRKLDDILGSTDESPKVFDLIKDRGTSQAFDLYEPNESMYIIVCGGDGSVCWVLNEIDQRVGAYGPAVAVMPLGTGNDMARFLKWGSRFNPDSTEKFVNKVLSANVIHLDRWNAELVPITNFEESFVSPETTAPDGISESTSPTKEMQQPKRASPTSVLSKVSADTISTTVFYNYFSVGVDAEVALDFHNERNANPELFTNRFMNLLHYGRISMRKLFDKKYLFGSIAGEIELQVDGVRLSDKDVKNVDGLLFLNIKTYAAGMKPWSGKCRRYKYIRRRVTSVRIYEPDHNRFSTPVYHPVNHEDFSTKVTCGRTESVANERRGSVNSNTSSIRSKLSRKMSFRTQHCDDGFLEIIGFRHYELANMKMGIQGRRLAQGSHIVLTIKKSMALEFDGEPVLTDPCIITVQRKNQANMLSKRTWKPAAAERSFFFCC